MAHVRHRGVEIYLGNSLEATLEGAILGSTWPGCRSPRCCAGRAGRMGKSTGRARQTSDRERRGGRSGWYGQALHPGSRSTLTGCLADKIPAPLGAGVRGAAAPLDAHRSLFIAYSRPGLPACCTTSPMPGNSESRCSRRRSTITGSGGSSPAAGAARTVPATSPSSGLFRSCPASLSRRPSRGCGVRPTCVRIEECGGPEHREDRLQVVLIGGGAVG